jgi:DNA polymerase-3 subunit delta'
MTRGFARVLGHQRAIAALQAQLRSGRLAHALCFIGEESIGKTTLARALAEEVLLADTQVPRLEVHPDYWIDDRVEAISIDEIRFAPEKGAQAHDQSLQQFLSLKPFTALCRVAVLANAERMTEAAQNCLLKTLEEPPPNTVLILTTAYPDHLLPTCLSRCQVMALSPVNRTALETWLREQVGAHEEASRLAAFAQGRPGLAVRAQRDPAWFRAWERWTAELIPLAFAPLSEVLTYAGRFGQGPAAEQRPYASAALRALSGWLKDAILVQAGAGTDGGPGGEDRGRLTEWVTRIPAGHLPRALAAAQRTQLLIDQNVNPRLAMETFLLDFRVPQA